VDSALQHRCGFLPYRCERCDHQYPGHEPHDSESLLPERRVIALLCPADASDKLHGSSLANVVTSWTNTVINIANTKTYGADLEINL